MTNPILKYAIFKWHSDTSKQHESHLNRKYHIGSFLQWSQSSKNESNTKI